MRLRLLLLALLTGGAFAACGGGGGGGGSSSVPSTGSGSGSGAQSVTLGSAQSVNLGTYGGASATTLTLPAGSGKLLWNVGTAAPSVGALAPAPGAGATAVYVTLTASGGNVALDAVPGFTAQFTSTGTILEKEYVSGKGWETVNTIPTAGTDVQIPAAGSALNLTSGSSVYLAFVTQIVEPKSDQIGFTQPSIDVYNNGTQGQVTDLLYEEGYNGVFTQVSSTCSGLANVSFPGNNDSGPTATVAISGVNQVTPGTCSVVYEDSSANETTLNIDVTAYTAPTPPPTEGTLTVSPYDVVISAASPSPEDQTQTVVSESGYTGAFTYSDTACAGIATLSWAGGSANGPSATLIIVGNAGGACQATISDSYGQVAYLEISVGTATPEPTPSPEATVPVTIQATGAAIR